jgi:AmmeMemoRadiSam system protein B
VLESTSQYVETAVIRQLAKQLEEALALEGPAFEGAVRSFYDASERPAAMAGASYASEPRRLRHDLDRFFKAREGAGTLALPAPARNGSAKPRLRAIVSPHIDFPRGGPVYTWAYKALVEQSDADGFVILGVAHQPCRRRFVLTRKAFATPLGVAATDRAYVDRLAQEAGAHLFDDELTHRSEHSIEFQAVFLKHVLGDRPFTIVPILVGSFHDLLVRKADPITDPEVARFIRALRTAEAASGRKVAYIGGVDLCHVGPEFGDPDPVDGAVLDRIRDFDHRMLARAEAVDPLGWFRTASDVGDRWRVCGLAATYTMLQVLGPSRGELLKYNQAVDDRGTCCVSFASMVFHAVGPAAE